ncbi:unnamed protein product [Linum trigynum]|uniref:Uncharacterized protein n=1 Tax=Linum trigynum TaxID=586398 RepID=A0AAV2F645_9ROSI
MEEGDLRISNNCSDPCLFLSSSLFLHNDGWWCSQEWELRDGGLEEWRSPRGVLGKPVIRGRAGGDGIFAPEVAVVGGFSDPGRSRGRGTDAGKPSPIRPVANPGE